MLNSSVQAASSAVRTTGRLAARHDRVNGHLLDAALDQIWRHHRHGLVRLTRAAVEHRQHALGRGRNQGQAVGPAAGHHGLELVLERGQLHTTRAQLRGAEARGQYGCPIGVNTERATARAQLGQPRSQSMQAAEALPLAPMPAQRALLLHALLHPQQRGHRLDLVMPGELERGVVAGLDPLGEARVVLGVHRQAELLRELLQHRDDQLAGRAVPLHERDDPIGQGRFHELVMILLNRACGEMNRAHP